MPSYAPPGESASNLLLEHSNYAGMMLVSFAYGIYLTLAGSCAYLMVYDARPGRARNWPILVYIFILSLSSTVFWISGWIWGQMMFIDYRGYPGGPAGFFTNNFGIWANTPSDAALLLNNLLADGLVLWRCALIWDYNMVVVTLGALTYVATTVCAALSIYQTSKLGNNPLTDVQFTIPYFSLTLSLNISLTLLIVGRLLWHRRGFQRTLGGAHGHTYTTLAAVLVESAALYSITTVALIVAFVFGSSAVAIVLPLLGEIMCIAPMLILLRVAFGQGYTRDTQWRSASVPTSNSFAFNRPYTASRRGTEFTSQDSSTVLGVASNVPRRSIAADLGGNGHMMINVTEWEGHELDERKDHTVV